MKNLLIFLCGISLIFCETISHGDNKDDGFISFANITANISKKGIPLYDTEINFDTVFLIKILQKNIGKA